MEDKKFTKEEIEKVFSDLFFGKESFTTSLKTPYIKNHKWEQDGEMYSSWEIFTGTHTLHTGDAGAEIFIKAFNEPIDIFKNEKD